MFKLLTLKIVSCHQVCEEDSEAIGENLWAVPAKAGVEVLIPPGP